MENIILMIFFFLVFGVVVPVINKNQFKDNVSPGDIVYNSYWSNLLMLFLLISIIYTVKINFNLLLIIFLIVWVIYEIFKRTNKGKELQRNQNFYKIVAIPGPFVGIILELYIFLNKHFGPIMFISNEAQFKIVAFLSILLLIWSLYSSTKLILHFIFKERDGFRKVFIISQVIVVIIYAAFTIFYIFNTNLLTFY